MMHLPTFKWVIGVALLVQFCESGAIKVTKADTVPEAARVGMKRTIKASYSFSDKSGIHFLLLMRDSVMLSDGTKRVSLQAAQSLNSAGSWKKEWTINDKMDCKDLDLTADFIDSLTSISDMDANGLAESTIAYRLSCSGDIEPETVKVIMRQGKEKYAIRGLSVVKIEGAPTEGSTFAADPNLKSKKVFYDYLVVIWKKAAGS